MLLAVSGGWKSRCLSIWRLDHCQDCDRLHSGTLCRKVAENGSASYPCLGLLPLSFSSYPDAGWSHLWSEVALHVCFSFPTQFIFDILEWCSLLTTRSSAFVIHCRFPLMTEAAEKRQASCHKITLDCLAYVASCIC
ncbi:unnamed protein product [Ostreobium quekettii]|uniref:Uncharacterized protein n=1 Tax=Ostreobium quekettii TaxID=121088 RepID=A0A8S1ILP1_9CHLO|nr:unnamed protein product [Ostreobium quekettii]|eukprot:evm.model.scf_24.11 EVM.evm.TU.scf_24.11   scf_24:216239-216649(+)